MDILYRDDHIVVCVKPDGVLSAKDASAFANMTDMLKEELGVDEVFPIHRLDRDVSGVMVYALSSLAASKLSSIASDHTKFVKEYFAVVGGSPKSQKGVFEDLLFKDTKRSKSFVVSKMRKGVRSAKLEYEVLENFEDYTLVKILLHTGRTHQIRVQFASRKMPLFGDRKYGGQKSVKGIALRSVRLAFNHPITNERMLFEKIPDISEMI